MELHAQFASDLHIHRTSTCNSTLLISHLPGLCDQPQVLRPRGMYSSCFVSNISGGCEGKTVLSVPLTSVFTGGHQELSKQFRDDPELQTKAASCCLRDVSSTVPREEKSYEVLLQSLTSRKKPYVRRGSLLCSSCLTDGK